MKSKFSVSTLWDSRAVKANKSRVMLSISLNRDRFLVSIKIYCTQVDYEKAIGGRSLSSTQKTLRTEINDYVLKADSLLSRLTEPTKDTFLKFFKSDANLSNGSKVDAYALYQVRFDSLTAEGRFGTAHNLRCSWYSIRSFKKELFLEDIDETFLKSYRAYMLKKKSSNSTIGIYLRNLRAVYNQAVTDGLISGNNKPFKNVVIGSSVKSKSVLYPHQLKALWEYRCEGIRTQRAIAFFFFCYLANGMNFKDVGFLKYKNIQGNVLSYVREKTKRTKSNNSEIKVHLHDAMKKIIEVWGNPNQKPDEYIFKFMSKYKSDKHMEETITRYKRVSNKMLAIVGKELGFEVHLCLNLARHSFATKQKIDGTPVAFISDAMGHSSLAVTEHYLKSLPDNNLALLNSKLLSF